MYFIDGWLEQERITVSVHVGFLKISNNRRFPEMEILNYLFFSISIVNCIFWFKLFRKLKKPFNYLLVPVILQKASTYLLHKITCFRKAEELEKSVLPLIDRSSSWIQVFLLNMKQSDTNSKALKIGFEHPVFNWC